MKRRTFFQRTLALSYAARSFGRQALVGAAALVSDRAPAQSPIPKPPPMPPLRRGSNISYAGMSSDSWLRITAGGPPSGIGAYSGFCIDDIRDQLLIFGGGHHDYGGNEIWTVDLTTGVTAKTYNSDNFALTVDRARAGVDNANHPGIWMPSGRPIPRHTYNSNVFVSDLGLMFVGGSSTYDGPTGDFWLGSPGGGVWPNSPNDTWKFDPASATWTWLGSSSVTPDASILGVAVYAPDLKKVYCFKLDPLYIPQLWLFDPAAPYASAWAQLHPAHNPPTANEPGGTYDTKRSAFVVCTGMGGADTLWRFRGGDWENITPPGMGPAAGAGYGIAYDSINDAYGIYGTTGLWIVDAANPTIWIKAASGPRIDYAQHGKFKFDAKRGVFLTTSIQQYTYLLEIWAYRWKSAAPIATDNAGTGAAVLVVREPSGTAGMAFRQGAFPHGVFSDLAQVGIKNLWPDGSVKLAVLSWDDPTVSSTAPKTITFKQGAGNVGAVSLGNLRALAPNVSVSLNAYGQVLLGSVISEMPFRTWQTGPLCSEWHWRAPVGSDSTLVVWFHVRLYASGALWIRTTVENGYTMVPVVEKDYHATVTCAGRVIFDGDFKHWARSRWTQAFWYDGRPLVAPQHDGAYLIGTGLFPHFGYEPGASAFFYDQTQYVSSAWWDGTNGQQPNPVFDVVPLGVANQRPDQTPGGYSPSIGIVPLWDVLYLLSGREDMYHCVIANACAGGTFTAWRDENTNLPVKWSDRPNLWAGRGDPNSMPPSNNTTPSNLHWDIAHHPSYAFGAYVFSGDYYFVETMQMVANTNWAGLSYGVGDRSGALGVCWAWVAPRAVAWYLRTLGQTLCITPDDDPLAVDYKKSVDANVQRQLDVHVDGTFSIASTASSAGLNWGTQKNNLGAIFCGGTSGYTQYSAPPLNSYYVDAPWMQNFFGATLAHIQDLGLTGIDPTKLDRLMRWALKHAVGLLGDDSGYPYTFAGAYALPYMHRPDGQTASSPPSDPTWVAKDWATVYAWFQAAYPVYPNQKPLAPNAPLFNSQPYGSGQDTGITDGYVDSPSFAISMWANLMPAISAAVDKGVPGAAVAWSRLTNASNFASNAAYFHDRPLWGVVPRSLAKAEKRFGRLDTRGTVCATSAGASLVG